jgi:hypothetical protein
MSRDSREQIREDATKAVAALQNDQRIDTIVRAITMVRANQQRLEMLIEDMGKEIATLRDRLGFANVQAGPTVEEVGEAVASSRPARV